MKKENWQASIQIESEFKNALLEAFLRFSKQAKQQGISVALLNDVSFLAAYARQAVERMISGLYFKNARTWREAAYNSLQARRLFAAQKKQLGRTVLGNRVRELIRESAVLIKSFPIDVAQRVAAQAAAHGQAGGRTEGLMLSNKALSTIARSRARLIARTQISKANTALTEARSEEIGITAYVWETSQDERVRSSHKKMQGIIVFWNDPPSPEQLVGEKNYGKYQAGGTFNCRCYPAPLIRLDQVQWPHRVFWNNSVQRMTIARFRQISRIDIKKGHSVRR